MKNSTKYTARKIYLFASLLAMIGLLSSFTLPYPWIKLGTQTASFRSDYDEILVTGRRGTFDHIRLEVKKANIHLTKVVVIYRHGAPETIQVKRNIPAGSFTRAVNLRGGNRIIHKVVFYYNTHAYEGKRAKITLWGKH